MSDIQYRSTAQPKPGDLQNPTPNSQPQRTITEAMGLWEFNVFSLNPSWQLIRKDDPTRALLELTNEGPYPVWIQTDQPAPAPVGKILRPGDTMDVHSTQDIWGAVSPDSCADKGNLYANAIVTFKETLTQ